MSYKHSQLAERLLEDAGIIYSIPTAGHYVIYKEEVKDDGTDKLIWYPKSNKIQTTNEYGKPDIREMGTLAASIVYIVNWLNEENIG